MPRDSNGCGKAALVSGDSLCQIESSYQVIAQNAHHRGQMAMQACQFGHPLPQKAVFGMWE
jgi:hypothetical protein